MPHTVVIFGASGDLTSRKLIPALFSLHRKGRLPNQTRIVGVARTEFSHDAWRAELAKTTEKYAGKSFDAAAWQAEDLRGLPGLESEEDQDEELAYTREWFPTLRELYRQAQEHDRVIVCEQPT